MSGDAEIGSQGEAPQRPGASALPAAIVAAAVIVGGALVFHGIQLGALGGRMEGLEDRVGSLEVELDTFVGDLDAFSDRLPAVIAMAGRDAGRQAVHGVFEEAVQAPLRRISPELVRTLGEYYPTAPAPVAGPRASAGRSVGAGDAAVSSGEPAPRVGGVPTVQFNVPGTVINIDLFPQRGRAAEEEEEEKDAPGPDPGPLPVDPAGLEIQ